jgi:calcineurin-like phosphoesterase family protein
MEDNTAQFLDQWKKTIRNDRCVVYLLGDVAFSYETLDLLKDLKGRKILVKGNHDDYVTTKAQAEIFEDIHGIIKYKKMWLSHAPIHPAEMRGRIGNVHGHVHNATIMRRNLFGYTVPDPQYFNACVDVVYPKYDSWFATLDQVKEYFK